MGIEEQAAGGWAEHRADQLDRWLATTPAQRVEWLEQMLTIAISVGALRREPAEGRR